MSSVIASRRYAAALFSAAEEGNFLDQIVEEMNEIGEVLKHSRDLVHILRSPLVQNDKKVHILEDIFKGRVGDKVFIFLKLVGKKNRLGHLPQIVEEFQILVDEKREIININVTSAVELNDEQANDLVMKLGEFTGKKVRARMLVNEAFIGGVSIKIGDTIYDGTVSHQLQMLRQTLVSKK